ncbi:hypothetical protein GGI07_002259 [Coemansia sp. Benny D115]|nr:hypothetical protein GGI07_002259 [Coemansia sp. Benny D115]
MKLNTFVGAVVGALASTSALAAPMNDKQQENIRQDAQGFPFFSPTRGTGEANIELIVGGGILPTVTFAGGLSGHDNQIVGGISDTIGIGGAWLPTASAGFGGVVFADPYDVIVQGSVSASEGGWLNGAIPTLQGGNVINGNVGFKYSSGHTGIAGINGGISRTLGYGGIFLPSSNLVVSGGGNLAFGIHNGKVTPTSTP